MGSKRGERLSHREREPGKTPFKRCSERTSLGICLKMQIDVRLKERSECLSHASW